MASASSPTIEKVMARYPGVVSLDFPPEALEWSEKEVDMFVASGGFLKPKRKKPLAKAAPLPAPSEPPAASPVAGRAPESSATLGAVGAAPPCPEAAAGGGAAAAAATTSAVESPELGALAWREGQYWGPYTTYMEDVGERGLKLVAVLNKCERFRNVGLGKGAGLTLNDLKVRFGAGILLREFALEVTAEPPREIMSVLSVSLRLELPCAPFMPMYQVVVPAGGGAPVCKAVFGMLMLETATMSVLSDNSVYEKVAIPLRKAFGIPKPTGQEGVPKFPRIYPTRGAPFRPLQLYQTRCTIMPSDCDMYRVIFHPQIVAVCERANFAAGVPFREEPGVAIYGNLAKPAKIGDEFEVRIFAEPPEPGGPPQTRVLYLFASAAKGPAATSPPAAAAGAARCVMAAFLVYGPSPGRLFSEDVSACAAAKLGALEAFGGGGPAPAADKSIDLSRCARA